MDKEEKRALHDKIIAFEVAHKNDASLSELDEPIFWCNKLIESGLWSMNVSGAHLHLLKANAYWRNNPMGADRSRVTLFEVVFGLSHLAEFAEYEPNEQIQEAVKLSYLVLVKEAKVYYSQLVFLGQFAIAEPEFRPLVGLELEIRIGKKNLEKTDSPDYLLLEQEWGKLGVLTFDFIKNFNHLVKKLGPFYSL